MGKITSVNNQEVKNALEGLTRQYFVGNLKKEQNLSFVRDERLEIGITNYEQYTDEQAHYHTEATEYQYMVSGWTKYLDLDTGVEYEFKAGDFYTIFPDTKYAQKAKKGTTIIFIKVPSINDKVVVADVDKTVTDWYASGLKTVRKDYFHDANAPKPNSIHPAAAVALVDDDKVLMLKRKDNKKWTLPGGTLDFGESLTECAIREVMEETGFDISIQDVVGTYTDGDIRIEYSDGEVRQEFTIVYLGKINGGFVELDDESSEYKWINLSDVQTLEMAESQKRRIEDLKKYLQTGIKNLR